MVKSSVSRALKSVTEGAKGSVSRALKGEVASRGEGSRDQVKLPPVSKGSVSSRVLKGREVTGQNLIRAKYTGSVAKHMNNLQVEALRNGQALQIECAEEAPDSEAPSFPDSVAFGPKAMQWLREYGSTVTVRHHAIATVTGGASSSIEKPVSEREQNRSEFGSCVPGTPPPTVCQPPSRRNARTGTRSRCQPRTPELPLGASTSTAITDLYPVVQPPTPD